MRKFLLLLGALAVVRLVIMATCPVFDPSEARYATLSANMARTGDYVVPRFTHQGEYQSFDGKPPLVFQAGGLFCEVFGVCEFAVRLFPFLSAVLLLFIMRYAVRRLADGDEEEADERSALAVMVTATTSAFYAAAGISMTDMTLTCCVAGSLLLYACCREKSGGCWPERLGIAALLGAGMIVKGPVSLALFGLPVLVDAVLNRKWRTLFDWRWLAVAPVFLLIAVPWFVLVEERNPGSVVYFFYNENFLRFIKHDYGDKYGAGREKFRGVAVVWAFVATLPWVLVPWWRKLRSFPAVAFLAITGFWCLTSRVLLYYLFPMIPLFTAHLALIGDRKLMRRILPYAAAVSAAVVVFGFIGGAIFSDKMQGRKAPYNPRCNEYSYEFYHGTPADPTRPINPK